MEYDKDEKNYGKMEVTFAAIAEILYAACGFFHIAKGLGISTIIVEQMFVPGDILGGLCLVVKGAVFLYGSKEMLQGINAGVSFLYVGILMSLVFMLVYLLIMGGSLLDSFIVPDDYEGWSMMETFRPGIYMGVLSLAGISYWKDRFSMNEMLAFREGP